MRSVFLSVDQIETLEELGKDLLRLQDHRAASLLAIVLQWRSLGRPYTEPSNVVDLHSYSRKTPCA